MQYLDSNRHPLAVQLYIENGASIETSCAMYKLICPLIEEDVITVTTEDFTKVGGFYKNKDGLFFKRYFLYIMVNVDVCTSEKMPSIIKIFKELKTKAEAYPDFEKLTRVRKDDQQDCSKRENRIFFNRKFMFDLPRSKGEQQGDEDEINVEMHQFSRKLS